MANRSNRRPQTPKMSEPEKAEKAIGSRRANSPLWSCIQERMLQLETEYTFAVVPKHQQTGCLQTRRSPYRSYSARPNSLTGFGASSVFGRLRTPACCPHQERPIDNSGLKPVSPANVLLAASSCARGNRLWVEKTSILNPARSIRAP